MLTAQSQKADYYHPERLVRPSPRQMRYKNRIQGFVPGWQTNLEAIIGKQLSRSVFPSNPRTHSRVAGRSSPASGARPDAVEHRLPDGAIIAAVGVFLVTLVDAGEWGDEAPWLPAGLAASVVLLVALSAREVVMRRAWTRYLLENGIQERTKESSSRKAAAVKRKVFVFSPFGRVEGDSETVGGSGRAKFDSGSPSRRCATLSRLLRALTKRSAPEVYGSEKGIALRAGQERVRALHKHHLLTWARVSREL